MNKSFFGRKKEVEILENALQSEEAEMVSVIGRRRVGKTFLVESTYQDKIVFKVTGIQDAPRTEQLQNFMLQIAKYSKGNFPSKQAKNWLEAFFLLTEYLDTIVGDKEKKVVFLDELPWLSTHKSGFLRGLSYFWNSWAVGQNIVVVICGSAASWMIKKVVNHRGGLHNRITRRIDLYPFTLLETAQYLKNRGIHFDHYQIIQLYMAVGGIPHYLKEIKKGESATQNINQICFSQTGLLRDEFSKLYVSLFENAENHVAVIRCLAKKRQGLTRKQIEANAKIPAGGLLSRVLEELVQSGFISAFRPFKKKKKEKIYRLTDEYSLFYLYFIENKEHEGDDIWNHLSQTQTYQTWSGYTFESICLKHIPQIKKALGISGIYSLSGSFYKKGIATEKGAQIDLLIDRNDHVINLFEIKFYRDAFALSKSYNDKLREKAQIFQKSTQTRKQIFWVFISTFGLKNNAHKGSVVAKELTMEDLFIEVN